MSDVNIVITRETAAVSQLGFGIPLIVGVGGAEPYTEWYGPEDITSEYGAEVVNMANVLFSQRPRLRKVAVVGFDSFSPVIAGLNALITEENDWYFLLCQDRVVENTRPLAAWAELNGRLYFTSPTADVAATITLAEQTEFEDNEYSVILYHDEPSHYPDVAWVGKCAPTIPGSITWKFKTFTGQVPASLTTAQLDDLHAANVNAYIRRMGMNITSEGKTTSGVYIDVVRGTDWLRSNIAHRVQKLLTVSPKVPYDNPGIASVLSEIKASLQEGTANGLIARDADGNGIWTVSAPDRADIDPAIVETRVLPDITFECTFSGAVHGVDVAGVVRI